MAHVVQEEGGSPVKVSKYLVKKAIEFELAKQAAALKPAEPVEAAAGIKPQRRKFDRFKHRLARDKQP
jgi:hypothetical protein